MEVPVQGALSETVFSGVLDRAQWPLYRFVRGLITEDEPARELVQDIFCDAWRTAQRTAPPFTAEDDEHAMRRWLFHAAYCRAVSILRRRRLLQWVSLARASEPEIERPELQSPFEDQVIEGEVLRAALDRLSPADAACLLLNVVHGFTAPELAQMLGMKPEAVKKRVTRAKKRLRAAYFAENVAAEG
jgi:RNA polymerase sigma-70 factor (ECF subfamily)